jgi:hypothetical protein
MKLKLYGLTLFAVLLLPCLAFTQSQAPKAEAPKTPPAKSEAQKSFDVMKSLAGEWEGPIATDMSAEMKEKMGAGKGAEKMSPIHVSLRVTSRGNALVHELQEAGTPLDATKYDHPVTLLYLDGDQLNLVHYCDAGNRPRMTGKMSADGKTVEFEFADITGKNQQTHMHHAVFTIIDADHHT